MAWGMGLSNYLDPLNSGVSGIDGIGISGINISHTPFEDMSFDNPELIFSANVEAYEAY